MLREIEKTTGKSGLEKMSWKTIVDEVILPMMAGPKGTRWCINDRFMNFLAEFSYDVSLKDEYTATQMLEIALQRLSCGAVLHEPTPWPEPLNKEYHAYSSYYDEPHILTEGCYNFILKAMETCLKNKTTHFHALKILFGIIEHVTPNGELIGMYVAEEVEPKMNIMYAHAIHLVEHPKMGATFDDLYTHYAKPGQWEKHKQWFADNLKQIDWKRFFADTKCLKGNPFQRWQQKRAIKKEIGMLTVAVAW